ncbi:MAG: 50S ribosomal protein L9 [Pseudomonadota bacterium]
MQIILLERVENLGDLGDVVNVKNGFARNFLLPNGKALVANSQNRARFEAEREIIERRNADARDAASTAGEALDGQAFTLIRQAGDTGQLYGSVTARDIVEAAGDGGHKIKREQVRMPSPIKAIGLHPIGIRLHPEVRIEINLNIARSLDEAERQAAGENIIDTLRAEHDEAAEEQASEMADAAAELDTAPDEDS